VRGPGEVVPHSVGRAFQPVLAGAVNFRRKSRGLRPLYSRVKTAWKGHLTSWQSGDCWSVQCLRRGGPDIALDVWVTKEQEGLKHGMSSFTSCCFTTQTLKAASGPPSLTNWQ